MSKSVLRVPIRLDALRVANRPLRVGLPLADFSRLPYFSYVDSMLSRNNEHVPNVGAEARNAPFHDRSLELPAGIHLHWALPDALTVGQTIGGAAGSRTHFPPVPNRWWIRRSAAGKGKSTWGAVEKEWVVESDFLHPLDANQAPHFSPSPAWPGGQPISFPVKRLKLSHEGETHPGAAFRYMGRHLSLAHWRSAGNQGDYLNHSAFSDFKLTAVGYGEPAFAAYYPSSYSVFGFCDHEALPATTEVVYEVIGWYQETDLDCLQADDFKKPATDAEKYQKLLDGYAWAVAGGDRKKPFPAQTVCYASLTLTPEKVGPFSSHKPIEVALGNTGSEALAALMAERLDSTAKSTIEDQLEAINLSARLQGQTLDFQQRFAAARHERGFTSLDGGSMWAVLPRPASPHATAAEAADQQKPQPTLPDAVAHALDRLNQAQEAYHRTTQELDELRDQLFCDWYKFMLADHSTEPDLQIYKSNLGSLVDFVNRTSLKLVQDRRAFAGRLVQGHGTLEARDDHDRTVATLTLATHTLAPSDPPLSSLAVQVLVRLRALAKAVEHAGLANDYQILRRPGGSFYQPNEPVVLLAGDVATSTPRHGEDGRLPCAVLTLDHGPGSAGFFHAIDTLRPSPSADDGKIAVRSQTSEPWHPILLEWDVDVYPVTHETRADPNVPDMTNYKPEFVSGNYSLPENSTTFKPTTKPSTANPNRYVGRCVMTPHASTVLKTNLKGYLQHLTLEDCRDKSVPRDHLDAYVDQLIAWYRVKHSTARPPQKGKLAWLATRRPFEVEVSGVEQPMPLADLQRWYVDKPVAGKPSPHFPKFSTLDAAHQALDPIYSAIRALSRLGGLNVLSQALGGFNAALRTRSQTPQLPVDDPMEPPKDIVGSVNPLWKLTRDVRQALAGAAPLAPLPETTFSPLRSGMLSLNRLSLLDTFGQLWNPDLPPKVVKCNSMTAPGVAQVYLSPRLAPPARLDCRWLAASSGTAGADEVEANDSPATTPICGWLVPDPLDNSVKVYTGSGLALGSVNVLAEWRPAPGPGLRLRAADIPNPHLRRVVRTLCLDESPTDAEIRRKQAFLQAFLSTLDSALETIEPESFAQHQALALWTGRPIAVVRVSLELRLLGEPLVTSKAAGELSVARSSHWKSFADESWDPFAFDWGSLYGCTFEKVKQGTCLFSSPEPLDKYSRTTRGFEKVRIPVRLGEYGQLDDGLVGFWVESQDGALGPSFYAPQAEKDLHVDAGLLCADDPKSPCIRPHRAQDPARLSLALDDPPLHLTLLMDPRGKVHATSGVLPVSVQSLPPAQYTDALRAMGVTFLTSPIVTDGESLHLPLPSEAGFRWSWVSRALDGRWHETTEIHTATPHAHFFHRPRIVEGWLRLTPDEEED